MLNVLESLENVTRTIDSQAIAAGECSQGTYLLYKIFDSSTFVIQANMFVK
jgi:hypothetical protein